MNFKPQCNTQAELFAEAARVSKMCEGTSISIYTCIKFDGSIWGENAKPRMAFDAPPYLYEFAMAIIEGKPVFRGEYVYRGQYRHKVIGSEPDGYLKCEYGNGGVDSHPATQLSWNPPLPKTVMVELTVDIAAYMAEKYSFCGLRNEHTISKVCQKALDSLK